MNQTKRNGTKATEYYFGYGYNLNERNFCNRIGRKVKSEFAILPNYKLVFNVRSKNNEKSFANIEPSRRSFVMGALYQLTQSELEKLDCFEDVEKGTYQRVQVEVLLDNEEDKSKSKTKDEPIIAWTYICLDPEWRNENLLPEEKYVENIIVSLFNFLEY